MTPVECKFESEVLAAAIESRWPDTADAELRAHVSGCAVCTETVLVAGAIGHAREEMRDSIMLPDSGRVWWLAQLRARREAIEAAGRPITAVQLIACACAFGLLGAYFGATSAWFQSAVRWVASSPVAALVAGHIVLAVAMGAALILIPAAAYFAIVKD